MNVTDPESRPEADHLDGNDTLPDEAEGPATPPKEIGGRGGLDPTRYGDWEKAGRCIDF